MTALVVGVSIEDALTVAATIQGFAAITVTALGAELPTSFETVMITDAALAAADGDSLRYYLSRSYDNRHLWPTWAG